MPETTKGAQTLEDVRRIRADNEARAATHDRVETYREIDGLTPAGAEKAKPLEIRAVDGKVFVNSHGELVLDHDGVINAQQALAAAFQAVS